MVLGCSYGMHAGFVRRALGNGCGENERKGERQKERETERERVCACVCVARTRQHEIPAACGSMRVPPVWRLKDGVEALYQHGRVGESVPLGEGAEVRGS